MKKRGSGHGIDAISRVLFCLQFRARHVGSKQRLASIVRHKAMVSMPQTTSLQACANTPLARARVAKRTALTSAMAFSIAMHGGAMAIAAWMPPPVPSLSAAPDRTVGVYLVPATKAPPAEPRSPLEPAKTRSREREVVKKATFPAPTKKPIEKIPPLKLAAVSPSRPLASLRPPARISPSHKASDKAPDKAFPEKAIPMPDGARQAPRSNAGGASSLDPEALAWIMARLGKVLVYPRQARRRGWEGEVLVGFELAGSKQIRKIRLARGSGYPVLDRAAIEALGKLGAIPDRHKGTTYRDIDVTIPVVFRLTR
uniref:Protein TonB n=1 Tax=Candidatus Kentrum sp. LPFa TaxID=2126335 RepID=A0A450WD82_9GAMM|nr:MAG: protein TonB [Candidatus Kentron sp. LPFa]VFK30739.1 MAG: protein TonB [Candidatus Kentron sp. LPFa]